MTAADPLFDLTGRVAVVTGASSGLGRHFARVLRTRGVEVVVAGRRADRLQALAQELGQQHTLAVPTDVTDEDAVRNLVAVALDRFGRLDLLVNNAGISDDGPAESESLKSFEEVVAVNLAALFVCCREAAQAM